MAFKGSNKSEERKPHKMEVLKAHQFENNNVAFDLKIDSWITIYNMRLVATYSEADKKKKDKSKCEPESYFIAFPQHQDDKGNWWSYAYFKILQEEQDVIEEQIQYILDNEETK